MFEIFVLQTVTALNYLKDAHGIIHRGLSRDFLKKILNRIFRC
jgi:hypothetical protein